MTRPELKLLPAAIALALTLSWSTDARAQEWKEAEPPEPIGPSIVLEGNPVRWDPRWKKFTLGNYIGTGALVALSFGSLLFNPVPDRWTDINGFDDYARSALGNRSPEARNRARDASDVLLSLTINQVVIDTVIVTWWGHDRPEVTLQMALINVEALAFNSAINGIVGGLASRQRPYANVSDRDLYQCGGDAATELKDCRTNKRFRSYYSGHTSTAFTVAGLTCMHHSYLPLYGGGVPDGIACAGGLLAAGVTGMMRVVADQHFLTDVITGAVAGTISGTAIPYFLHYRTGDLPEGSEDDALHLQFVPMPTGGMLMGRF
ncbi:phosphatase PAP2 family protein [Desulfobulbus sp. AH-315-M07]|nr:phosphatase PAP2 family protein [Desulfobulbus sp. AH-315-M07]